ncbi:hypothetical protein [Sulfitobacter sp. S190]|uniref:hypothetical protein n=1 Tax=Sulfitobacter sp. S190 TaxID=2867022 RepID=UPI0021A277F2|nr:hypothetical protein [Sulfitobacter sp. S190]UWR23686.1 hypothetical protein K3756_06890 [Sulfitobacter sp. S190]
MTTDLGDMEPTAAHLAENNEVCRRLIANGVAMNAVERVWFFCDFRTEDDALYFADCFEGLRAELMPDLGPSEARLRTWEETDVPRERLVLLRMEFDLRFDVRLVTRMEHVLQMMSDELDGGEVTWEFETPTALQEMRLN